LRRHCSPTQSRLVREVASLAAAEVGHPNAQEPVVDPIRDSVRAEREGEAPTWPY